MRPLYLIVLLLATLTAASTFSSRSEPSVGYDIYITVGKGKDGEGGPVARAEVTLTSPDGSSQTKKSDEEGAVKFTVSGTGRYIVKAKADGFDLYEGRVIVDGKDPQVYHAAVLVPATVQGAVSIRVRVKDDETGLPIVGASVETTSKATPYTDRMKTDSDGEAVVRIPLIQWKRDTEYVVTVSSPGYASWTHILKADNRSAQVYPVEASLIRDKDTALVAITILEEGTRAPILGARVLLDGRGNRIFSDTTEANGTVVFRVPRGATYAVKVTTTRYDEYTDTIDLLSPSSPSVSPTYLLSLKESAREVRRALLVWVKFKDKKGKITPGKEVVVNGPGQHPAATDDAGRIVFLHTVPPGEMITVSANHLGYKAGSSQVMVRDKGVMVDLKQFSRDRTKGGMSDYDAVMKQGITGYDTVTLTLEEEWLAKIKLNGKIESDDEADPGTTVAYSTELTLAQEDLNDLAVEEAIQVFAPDGRLLTRAGSIRALDSGNPSTKSYSFKADKPGTYRIKSTVSYENEILWTGEKTVRVAENRRKATITGNVVPKKGLVKMDEPINVGVNVLYESGPTKDLRVSETVELFDPKGAVVQNNLGYRNLQMSAYSERNFNIVSQAPGIYRLKSTIKDESGEVLWTGEGRFEVDKVGKSVMAKGTGYYRLKNKVMGGDPGGGEGPDCFITASITESSFTYKYTPKPPKDAYADINLQWSVPPTVLKPNDTIELTVSGTASVRGRDRGAVGVGGGWGAQGSASVVEGKSIFVGLASDGKHYDSGSAKYKISTGRGGAITIFNYHSGAPGTLAVANQPCTYQYEWIENAAPPTSPGGKTTMNAGSENTKPADSNAYRSDSVTFGSFGSFSLEMKIGRDFTGTGRSKDGRSIITLYGAVNASGKLTGSGTLNRNGSKYTITVSGQKSGAEIVGEMSAKAAKGTTKGPFRLRRG